MSAETHIAFNREKRSGFLLLCCMICRKNVADEPKSDLGLFNTPKREEKRIGAGTNGGKEVLH